MIDPTKEDIGRLVVYRAGTDFQEEGVITSFNVNFVFVRFRNDLGSKACNPKDLTWSI